MESPVLAISVYPLKAALTNLKNIAFFQLEITQSIKIIFTYEH